MSPFFELLAEVIKNHCFEPLDDETLRRVNYEMLTLAPGPYRIALSNTKIFEVQFLIEENSEELFLWKLRWL